jgi:hypothetical protein
MPTKNVRRLFGASAAASIFIGTTAIALPAQATASDASIMAEYHPCASLDNAQRHDAWAGSSAGSDWCIVGGGDFDDRYGFSVYSYCAGEYNSLIRYNIPNDPYLYSSTASAFTCQPFIFDYRIVKVSRYR